jgi:hypothetical protein
MNANGGPVIEAAVTVSTAGAVASGACRHLKREGPDAGFEDSVGTGRFLSTGERSTPC